MSELNRRHFIAAAGAIAGSAGVLGPAALARQPGTENAQPAKAPKNTGDDHRGPCSIASLNGLRATVRAMELVKEGYDPADAVVQGVRIIEDDPSDTSVGLGGLPNEDGIVELDASVMYGPTHKAGAVAGLRNIKNPAMVALLVLRRTDHCLIVGDGALRFAKQMGFKEEDLLTEESRLEWQKWRENLGKDDDRLNDDERDEPVGKHWQDGTPEQQKRRAAIERAALAYTTGTVHCSVVTPKGDIASCTSTSGLSWKIPGRVGDSPIIGAGNYCDNAIGAAGSTGRGEANLANLSSFYIVECMGRGMTPTEACLAAAKRVADHTKEKRLLRAGGKPDFDLKFYALRKDGAYGGCSLYPGGKFAVATAEGGREVDAPSLFESR
ncbi:MAG TPA: N(4)-(beta-N-acetylglucosaminyl)-L-asparaginase [Phycisphaerales bacterium]|nr:N(4)-(beta-N-acetylglucosaminyl)-L-asparaginase [Phycisphaerales bacterium]